MPQPRFEVLSGVVDGLNQVFSSAAAYTAGTTAVFLDGQLKHPHISGVQDGWVETSPAAGTVTLDEAPRVGDVVQMFYLDTSPTPNVVQAGPEPLSASIQDVDEIDATFADVVSLSAEVAESQLFDAAITEPFFFVGSAVDTSQLSATLEASP